METLLYCDTNFYIDYLENRHDRLRPLGSFAFELLRRTIECEFKIIISDFVITELERYVKEEKIKDVLHSLKKTKKLVRIFKSKKDIKKARMLSKNKADALHAILAKKAGAEYIITRNLRDFAEFSHLVKPILPESI
ncbi:MAG: PIN domain-containing protein [Nanoarchaeota archaeon]|nr:PIN domain-containing protein [DPANN group archaeon]MBL7117011.1 PIN domain-containing protein [Nanoarchaeota archaeon]